MLPSTQISAPEAAAWLSIVYLWGKDGGGDVVKNMISHSVEMEDIQKSFDIVGEAQDLLNVVVAPCD